MEPLGGAACRVGPKKGNAKECSNHCTIALISHASKVMLKILQARLYAGGELQGSPVWQALAGHKRSFPLVKGSPLFRPEGRDGP